jgi:magnesium chelatase family protein
MDRIDIRLPMSRPSAAELVVESAPEGSAAVADRVVAARERSRARFAGLPWTTNAAAPAAELRRSWPLADAAADMLRDLERRAANLRGPDRVLRMAWTLADLAGRQTPSRDDVARAMTLRGAALAWST